jgi:hypothetical protein
MKARKTLKNQALIEVIAQIAPKVLFRRCVGISFRCDLGGCGGGLRACEAGRDAGFVGRACAVAS